jgi:hypothetical protein
MIALFASRSRLHLEMPLLSSRVERDSLRQQPEERLTEAAVSRTGRGTLMGEKRRGCDLHFVHPCDRA